MSESLTCLAPAKLNLFLHITSQREDGYHQIQTLFQLLDYGDLLTFTVNHSGVVRRMVDIKGVDRDQDIIIKAVNCLQKHSNCSLGVDITVEKRIPLGGGLGGGSSDAATTLLVLNKIWGLSMSRHQIAEIGLELGADVPIFVHGRSAWAEGVGEEISPMELPNQWYVVVTPPINANTQQLFADPQLTRDARPIKIRDYFAGEASNVFEPVAKRLFPEIGEVIDWLSENSGEKAKLTGTGASVYAAFDAEIAARLVADQVPIRWQRFVAKGINRSPVLMV